MSYEIHADYSQQFLLPPSLEDWVGPEHPVRFIRDFVGALDLRALGFHHRQAEEGRPVFTFDRAYLIKPLDGIPRWVLLEDVPGGTPGHALHPRSRILLHDTIPQLSDGKLGDYALGLSDGPKGQRLYHIVRQTWFGSGTPGARSRAISTCCLKTSVGGQRPHLAFQIPGGLWARVRSVAA